MFLKLSKWCKKYTDKTVKYSSTSIGFLLPVVITLGMGISTISIASLQTVTNGSTLLNNQYFDTLAREAAQAGISAAKTCITQGQKSWNDSSPLKPDTDCRGISFSGKAPTVADDSTFSSTYQVKGLQYLNAGTPVITSTGSASIKTTNGISVQTASVTIRTIVRTSTTSTGDASKEISQVSTNGSTTCTVAENWVYCWGDNTHKQLGVGNAALAGNRSTVPMEVEKGALVNPDSTKKIVLKVSVGTTHTCVVAKDSTNDTTGNTRKAYCWGENNYHQLGTIGASPATITSPAQVYNGPGQPPTPRSSLYGKIVVDISAGDNFTCALTSDGLVSCWGRNNNGQLGDGSKVDKTTPASIAYDSLSALRNKTVTNLAQVKNSSTMCALDSNYRAYCWGDTTVGQVGNNTHAAGGTTSSTTETVIGGGQRASACDRYPYTSNTTQLSKTGAEAIVRPTAVLGNLAFQSISVFEDSVTAISTSTSSAANRAYWWGGGNATTTDSRTCYVSNCRRSGQTSRYCRMLTTQTTVSYTSNGATGPQYDTGSSTGLNRKALSLATGNVYDGLFCAQAGGLLYCDGHGKYTTYQGLGDNSSCTSSCTKPSSPVPVFLKNATLTGWLSGKTITAIDTGGSVTCVVADKTVGCWGANDKGQLGIGTSSTTGVKEPKPVDVTTASALHAAGKLETGFDKPISF